MLMKKTSIAVLLLLLAGCATQPLTRQPQPEEDLFEVEKLASAAYENSDWQESEKHYTVLVEKDPEQPLSWLRLGNIYARTNRPDAAVMAYREALVRDPKLTNAWFNMGLLQLKQAAYSFNEMQLHIDPDDPVAMEGGKLLEGILSLIKGEQTP